MKSLRLLLIAAIAACHLSLSPSRAAELPGRLMDNLTLGGTLNKIKNGAILTVESGGSIVYASGSIVTFASGSTVTFAVPLAMANGGLGVALTDPNADRILFWDDSAGVFAWLTLGTNISITGTTINVASGGDFSSNTSSSVDGEVVVFSGTGGKTGKRYTATGLVKTASGVASAATAGTDYVAPGAFTSSGLTMATTRLLGRATASTGAAEELTIAQALDFLAGGTTRGSLIYRGASGWTTIAPGTTGKVLTSNGTGADPTYETVSGGGGVGDVVGPASAVDSRIAAFDTTTGKLLKDGGKTIAEINPLGAKTIYIPAAAMTPSTTNGCNYVTTVEIAANQPDVTTLDFDPSTEKYAQCSVAMPKSWDNGTVTVKFHWSHAATVTNFGVVWGAQGVAVSDADAMGTAFGTAQVVTDTGGTTNSLYTTSATSAITIAGSPATGDVVFFRVYRKAADASDTMTINARLHGVTIIYTTSSPNDT